MYIRLAFYVLLFTLLLVPSSAQTMQLFDGLPMDQQLITKANNGIADLKKSLNNLFTCQQACHKCGYSRRNFRRWHTSESYEYAPAQIRARYSRMGQRRYWWQMRNLKREIEQVGDTLEEVKETFLEYSNVVAGSGNAVAGDDNFVIGDYNQIEGNSNWIFASNIKSKNRFDGVLVVDDFIIEMVDLLQQSKDIRLAIHCTKSVESKKMRGRWWNGTSKRHRVRF